MHSVALVLYLVLLLIVFSLNHWDTRVHLLELAHGFFLYAPPLVLRLRLLQLTHIVPPAIRRLTCALRAGILPAICAPACANIHSLRRNAFCSRFLTRAPTMCAWPASQLCAPPSSARFLRARDRARSVCAFGCARPRFGTPAP